MGVRKASKKYEVALECLLNKARRERKELGLEPGAVRLIFPDLLPDDIFKGSYSPRHQLIRISIPLQTVDSQTEEQYEQVKKAITYNRYCKTFLEKSLLFYEPTRRYETDSESAAAKALVDADVQAVKRQYHEYLRRLPLPLDDNTLRTVRHELDHAATRTKPEVANLQWLEEVVIHRYRRNEPSGLVLDKYLELFEKNMFSNIIHEVRAHVFTHTEPGKVYEHDPTTLEENISDSVRNYGARWTERLMNKEVIRAYHDGYMDSATERLLRHKFHEVFRLPEFERPPNGDESLIADIQATCSADIERYTVLIDQASKAVCAALQKNCANLNGMMKAETIDEFVDAAAK